MNLGVIRKMDWKIVKKYSFTVKGDVGDGND